MPTETKSEVRNQKSEVQKILLVRNDNIGDLICSVPAIQFLRNRLPHAKIHLLVNSYNAPIAEAFVPKWVNRLLIYQKTKHVGLHLGQILHLIQFYWTLRKEYYDTVVLLVGGVSRQAQSFARWSGAPRILGYAPTNEGPLWKDGLHELEYSWNLITYLCGINEKPPSEIHYPIQTKGHRVGIQITSRKPGNQWHTERFSELARQLHSHTGQKSLLMWSPGNQYTVTHPGDNTKATHILKSAPDSVELRPTPTLQSLISVLEECRVLITPDGGAMHLAAAMGVFIVAMFGQSDPTRWRPWTPRAKILQSPTRTIQDISVEQVIQAYSDIP